MKKVFIMILFISFSFMFIGSVNALEYGRVTYDSGVNVRKGAGTNYSKLGTLKYNDAIYILNKTPIKSGNGCSSGWHKINYNGTYGYICSIYASTSGVTINTKTSVNIRNGAGTNYGIYKKAVKNKQMTLVSSTKYKGSGCSNGWYKLNYNTSTSKYICSSYTTNYMSGVNAIITNATGANIRSKATTKSTKIASVRYGQGVTLATKTKYKGTGCAAGYYKINYKGNIRYVCSNLVKIAKSNYVVNNLTGVNIRTKASSTSSKAIGLSYVKPVVLESTAKYKGTGCSSGWYKLNLNGKTRYVCSKYVTSTSNVTFTTSRVNVRNGLGTNYKIYKNLASNRAVVLLSTTKYSGAGCSAGWYKISLDGGTRYICSSYTELGKVSKSTTPEVKPEKSQATISFNVDDGKYANYNQILKDKLKFETKDSYGDGSLKYEGGKLSGLLLKNNKITLNTEDQTKYKNTPYYFAYVLEVPNASEKTTITTKGMNRTGEIKWEEFDEQGKDGKTAGVVVLVPVIEDQWKNEKSLTITVDVDGTEKKYEATEYKIDLSGLKFQTQSQATLNADENDISTEDKATLKEWGYTSTGENKHYKLESSENNTYKLSGEVEKQKLKENTFSSKEEEGYFFVFNLKKPENMSEVPEGVEVTVKGEQTLTYGKKYFNEKGVFTDLFKLKENCSGNCKITITVDWDGNGKQYTKSEEITIDYSELKFVKSSEFSIVSIDEGGLDKNPLESTFGWSQPENYDVTFSTDGANVKVKGFLPILESFKDKGPFDEEDETGYYLPFVIKTNSDVKSNGKVTVQFIHEGEESKTLTASDFDGSDVLYILRHLHKDATDKTFEIVVDMDGSADEYSPYTITFDWSDLKLQERTTASISIDESDVEKADKTTLEGYGYKFPNEIKLNDDNNEHKAGDLTFDESTGKLSGTIKEQKLTGGFGKDELDSYFFTYTIKPNKVTDKVKVSITDLNGTETYDKDNFVNGTLTILQHISLDKIDESNDPIKITVDADGDDNSDYKVSEEYTIDYSDVDFVNLHTVTLDDNDGKTKDTIDVYDGDKLDAPKDPVKAKHEKDDNQYNTFNHWNEQNGEEPNSESDTAFKFTDNKSDEPITDDVTLYPIWEIDVNQYITDALTHINEKTSIKDKFKIEKSLNDENALTVEILDRETKLSDINDTAIASTIAHALASGEIDTIELSLGDNEKTFDNKSEKDEAALKTEVSSGLKKFFNEEVSESGDNSKTLDDLYDAWDSENDKQLNITIFPEKTVAQIKGKSEGAGVVYNVSIEKEFIISYDAGTLKNPETQYAKKGESVELPTPEIPNNEKAYRTFDGWYDESEKVDNLNNVSKDENLTAHYKLNVEKFIEDIVKDLNSEDTTYSNDFSGKFDLEQSGHNITINVDGAKVPLTELAETSIPGTIAYILQKGEIKDITLTAGDSNSVTFNKNYNNDDKTYDGSSERDNELLGDEGITLKKEIIKGAKKVFDDELNQHEETATLDQLEYSDKKFSIKIGDSIDNETVELVKEDGNPVSSDEDKTYNFSFDSDFVVVDQDAVLGATDINAALTDSKNYSTVYIDGDINLQNSLNISAENDVNIKAVEPAKGIKLASENEPTINVTNNQDYAVDVQSGNVNISNLKITGGKKSQLRLEDNTKVTVDNIDVSGAITPAATKDEEMHAKIIVKGDLKVDSPIKNEDESYAVPTIALVTSYSYPGSNTDDEVAPDGEKHNLSTNGSVTVSNMTKNSSYSIVKKDAIDNIDSVAERYYGSFYYNNTNNSKIYFVGIMDPNKSARPYDYIKIYYYNDTIDFSKLGYREGETPEGVEDSKKEEVFKNFTLQSNGQVIKGNGSEKAGEVLAANYTSIIKVNYEKSPSAALNVQNVVGLTSNGNNLSGTLSTKSEDGKYYIPVTLTSEKFKEGETTVKVTDPNNKTTSYTYNSDKENGIATVSNSNTIKLQLEAIKSSNIKTNKGKVYDIVLDIDGDSSDEYQPETYTVDYNDVNTIVEVINKAAEKTNNANSLTVTKNNKIKSGTEEFTYEYNKDTHLTHYTSTNNNDEEYGYRIKDVDSSHVGDAYLILTKKKPDYSCNDEVKCMPELNDWLFSRHIQKIGMGVHELDLLQDVISDGNATEAISSVESSEDNNTYTITINKDRLDKWLNNNYISYDKEVDKGGTSSNDGTIKLEVKLSDGYISSMKTLSAFTINDENLNYEDNKIDITITKINSTDIEKPSEFLKGAQEVTNDVLKQCYEKFKTYWHNHTGSTIE